MLLPCHFLNLGCHGYLPSMTFQPEYDDEDGFHFVSEFGPTDTVQDEIASVIDVFQLGGDPPDKGNYSVAPIPIIEDTVGTIYDQEGDVWSIQHNEHE